MYFAGLVGFVLLLTAEARVGNSSESSFCSDTPECLLFELVCQTKEYEIRRYDSVNWVSTSFTLTPMVKVWWLDLIALVPAFRRLKSYFDDHGIKMRVAPGMVKIPEGSDSWMSKLMNTHEYMLKFLLPSAHQSNYPKPKGKVEIVETPEMYVYVRSYRGWLNEDADQAQMLLKSLGMSSDVTPHYAVAYTSPMNSEPHSEVWVIADGKPKCPA